MEAEAQRIAEMRGSRISAMRQLAGMNRPQLARKADVSYSFLVQVETGQRENPQADKLAKVAKALGVTIEYLLATDEPPPTEDAVNVEQLRREMIGQVSEMTASELQLAAEAIERAFSDRGRPKTTRGGAPRTSASSSASS